MLMLQFRLWSALDVPLPCVEQGTGIENVPPCAGMIQIRFDGRRLRTFLSARLTGLPCYDKYSRWLLLQSLDDDLERLTDDAHEGNADSQKRDEVRLEAHTIA